VMVPNLECLISSHPFNRLHETGAIWVITFLPSLIEYENATLFHLSPFISILPGYHKIVLDWS